MKIIPGILNRMINISENPSEGNLNKHFMINKTFHKIEPFMR